MRMLAARRGGPANGDQCFDTHQEQRGIYALKKSRVCGGARSVRSDMERERVLTNGSSSHILIPGASICLYLKRDRN